MYFYWSNESIKILNCRKQYGFFVIFRLSFLCANPNDIFKKKRCKRHFCEPLYQNIYASHLHIETICLSHMQFHKIYTDPTSYTVSFSTSFLFIFYFCRFCLDLRWVYYRNVLLVCGHKINIS